MPVHAQPFSTVFHRVSPWTSVNNGASPFSTVLHRAPPWITVLLRCSPRFSVFSPAQKKAPVQVPRSCSYVVLPFFRCIQAVQLTARGTQSRLNAAFICRLAADGARTRNLNSKNCTLCPIELRLLACLLVTVRSPNTLPLRSVSPVGNVALPLFLMFLTNSLLAFSSFICIQFILTSAICQYFFQKICVFFVFFLFIVLVHIIFLSA